MSIQSRALMLIGCGYLGTAVARLAVGRYRRIDAYVASATPRPDLDRAGVSIHVGDVFSGATKGIEDVRSRLGDDNHALVMLPPSRIPNEKEAVGALSEKLRAMGCNRAVLISSTGVYAAEEGGYVTAESDNYGDTQRSMRLREIETEWLVAAETNSILRLAGIYGPGRVIGLQNLRAGKPVGGSPDAWLNLIHVDDAAALSLRCLDTVSSRIELGADGNPVRRGEYYNYVAQSKNLPAPQFEGKSIRNTQSKRCDPSTSFRRLGFEPKFADFKAGVDDALAGEE